MTDENKNGTLTIVDFVADAGLGIEEADNSSFAVPFLTMLQGLSPAIETVAGAKPGLFMNSITEELLKEAMVIPCAFQRRYLRWAPRAEGGGFRGTYDPVAVETGKVGGAVFEDGRWTIDGDELRDTRNHFLLVMDNSGVWSSALLSLSSTQIKKSKRWMSLILGLELKGADGRNYNPPSFAAMYKLSATKEENNKGSWWGIAVDRVCLLDDVDLYRKAKDFHNSVVGGSVEIGGGEF